MIDAIDLTPVESSNVKAIGYIGGHLLVEFKNGGLYRYADVPRELYDRLLKAESVGKMLNAEIKPHYEYAKLN